MCGRATVIDPNGIESRFYGFTRRLIPSDWKPRYNLNPREEIPVVHIDSESGDRVLSSMHWNFVPSHIGSSEQWTAFDSQYSTFNAKIERVATAPTFKGAWRRQRCLVVVDGMIEWVGPKGRKVPHWIRHGSHGPFAMAGLWSEWRGAGDEPPRRSCTIVIGPCDDWYSRFHHRMAVLLRPALYDNWLDPDLTDSGQVRQLLDSTPFPMAEEMEAGPISRKVNNPGYDDPDGLCLVES